jgi:hypothetical protein
MLQLIFVIIAAGVLLYVVNAYVPMEANVKKLLNVVVVVCLVLYVLAAFGVFRLANVPVPQLGGAAPYGGSYNAGRMVGMCECGALLGHAASVEQCRALGFLPLLPDRPRAGV